MRYLFLGLLLFVTPVVAGTTKFDLKCSGTSTDADTGEQTPWSSTYTLDLDSKQFCSKPCSEVTKIKDVLPDRIVLDDRRHPTSVGPFIMRAVIDRVSGTIEIKLIMGRKVVEDSSAAAGIRIGNENGFNIAGSCTSKTFTGFPKTKF